MDYLSSVNTVSRWTTLHRNTGACSHEPDYKLCNLPQISFISESKKKKKATANTACHTVWLSIQLWPNDQWTETESIKTPQVRGVSLIWPRSDLPCMTEGKEGLGGGGGVLLAFSIGNEGVISPVWPEKSQYPGGQLLLLQVCDQPQQLY